MTKKNIIIIFLILIIPFGVIGWKYTVYRNKPHQKTPYFDTFIAESLYEEDKEFPWGGFWKNSWNNVSKKERRPIKWISNVSEFEKIDSVYLGFKNISNHKFYYVTWGTPNSRIRISYTVFKNGKIDSIPFGGFGCGTGIYITPLKSGKVAGSKLFNPLMFNPFTNYHLPLQNDKFPQLFKEIYGDSVTISFEQATYSLPWNKVPSQMIKSNGITVHTDKIIENWKKGKFKLSREFKKEYESGYLIKKGDDYELSSIFEKNE